MLPRRKSLNSFLLLLLVNFMSVFRLELMYTSLIESIRSSRSYLHGFQLLVLLPYIVEITFFGLTKRKAIRQASNHCKRVLEEFLHILIKQKSPSLPRNLAVGTFSKLSIVLSAKVNRSIEWPGGAVFCI